MPNILADAWFRRKTHALVAPATAWLPLGTTQDMARRPTADCTAVEQAGM
jgi:hypothetical protein